jgi:hypothetical protein
LASRVWAGLAVLFARTSFGFLAHYGNACAIHLHIEDGNTWPQWDRQLQLQGLLLLTLLPNFDIFSNGFGGSLHGLGSDRQTG